MSLTTYMTYYVWFRDPDEYAFATAVAGGIELAMCPADAAALFGITYPPVTGDQDILDKNIGYNYPYLPGATITNAGNPDSNMIVDDTVPQQTLPGVFPLFPPHVLSPDIIHIWSGGIVRKGAAPDATDPTPMAQRRWIGGVELTPLGEGGALAAPAGSRNASRTMDGLGFAIRGQNNSGTWNRQIDEYATGLITETSWERFYFRVRTVGTDNCGMWRCHGFPSAAAGAALWISTAGTLQLLSVSSISVVTVMATVAIDLNTWYKIDIFLKYNGVTGTINVYVNGILAMSFSAGGMTSNSRHTNSELGQWLSTGDNRVEIDLDDWFNAAWPANGAGFSLEGLDFLFGSHIRRLRNSSNGASANWTPALAGGIQNQGIAGPSQSASSNYAGSTSGSIINGITELEDETGYRPQETGGAAAVASAYTSNAGNTDGTLTIDMNGVVTAVVIDETAALAYRSKMYRPTGQLFPIYMPPTFVQYTKSADVNAATVRSLQLAIEMIGAWNQCDVNGLEVAEFPIDYTHNCRYGNTNWGFPGPIPPAAAYSVGGTYLGNGTQNVVFLPDAAHFIWIRPLTGGSRGVKWFGAALGGHPGVSNHVTPNYVNDSYFDYTDGEYKFTVTGTDAEVNANGVTYQYIVFCDPGMRFNLCGNYLYPLTGFTGRLQTLVIDDFLPAFGFAQKEIVDSTNDIQGLYAKGPGFAGDAGSNLIGSNVADFGNFQVGAFDIGTDIHAGTGAGNNYSLWRMQDTICGNQMLQIGTYTGDGTASRVITMPLVSGRFPLFILVVPNNAAAYMRDPSHTGSNSCQVNSIGNVATAITAGGMDSITVGITINQNGVVYSYFVILGSISGFINGTFGAPYCLPPDTPWEEPPDAPADVAVLAEGGLGFNGATALTLLKDVSGIYTLVPGKTDDTLYDRQTGQPSVDVKIPDPSFKTGYIGG